ncbi:T9SS type A sorting domain-containing protein [Olleya sp. R77988]|uniref:T9SS type A sorting domain-containing protein n=1 Tax=Olleya sp. R77988 TaxID=3093875 RepID=UPI0037CBB558
MRKITFLICTMLLSVFATAQCINTTSFGNAVSNNSGVSQQVSTCTYTSEYNTVTGLIIGDDYEFVATLAGADVYITVTDLADVVIGFGPSPLEVTATGTDVRVHITDDAACGSTSSCHVTSFTNISVTCPPTTALTATGITTEEAVLGWTSQGTETLWNIELVDITAGGAQTMTATESGVTNPYTATGLADGNDYEFYVQADCTGGDVSEWVGPFAFQTVPNCLTPTTLTVSSITASGADLGWTEAGTATTWNVEIVDITGGESQSMSPTATGVTNPYEASGLTDANDYEFYVQADCGGGSLSPWAGPFSFTTACVAMAAPYTEDFETFTTSAAAFTLENCWSGSGGTYFWESAPGTDTGSTGTGPSNTITTGNYFYTEASGGTAGDITDLTAPLMDLTALTAPAITFNYHMFGAQIGTLEVLVDGVSEFSVTGQQQASETEDWALAIVDLAAYAGQTVQVVIRATSAGTYEGDIAIDNVSFTEMPACDAPVATFTVVEDCVNGFSVDIDVTDLGSGASYDVQNGGASVGTISALGTTTVGPFANGTAITLTIVHPDDSICDVSESGLEDTTCPPPTVGTLTLSGGCGVANDAAINTLASGEIHWYELVYDGTCTDFTVDTEGGAFDTELGIYDATGNFISNNDDGGTGTLSLLSISGEPAGTYYVAAGSYNMTFGTTAWDVTTAGSNTGDLYVNVSTVIPNDECANAEALMFGVEVSADNTGATDSGVASTCNPATVADLWYSFVAGTSGEVTITTTAANYTVYSDCAGTEVSCNTSSVTGLTDGTTYYISVTDDGTARAQAPGAFTLTVAEATAGVNDFNADSLFSYYPNPVSNNLTLNAQKEISNVSVYNMIGQEVYRNAPNSVNNTVDMSNLQSGAYFVKVTIDNVTETVKVIKN